jgi:uncharacterized damage-inducible protein DinB
MRLMARYNAWMNAKVYDTAGTLPPEEIDADRGAFFKSVLGTLNHLVVADVIWLKRIAEMPASRPALDGMEAIERPTSLGERLEPDLASLRVRRDELDAMIVAFLEGLLEKDLDTVVRYARIDGTSQAKPLAGILAHLFNHQTHHRGQITTLFSQAGVDVGVTDLHVLVPTAD